MESRVITFSRNVFLPLTSVCANRCGYCSFHAPVGRDTLMPPDDVFHTLTQGAAFHCTEALFTFGEKPDSVPGFTSLLKSITGHSSILEYCYAMSEHAINCGLLPHTNAGILTADEMEMLRPVTASMGLMLETTAVIPAHANSPGKDPERRIEMIADAGHLKIPFTTGLLLGIGEDRSDHIASLEEISALHKKYGHIQECIIQNFCPGVGTEMEHFPSAREDDIANVLLLAHEILPSDIAIQIPPNLANAKNLISYGVNDLGGISPITIDYINPEHPWPQIEELAALVGDNVLQERLCIYPQYIKKGWYSSHLAPLIHALNEQVADQCGA
ncbi:MAG: 7,8-didemethyl-8-hydroxy-5-deazariboflavin synthase subunit CofG [Methanomicrobiales archaeon]|nr:7,8-didemethyl-8-hydroxy-5-deazariboflavin synthase subunit CofG [Methanomicrobiales archaeon]